MTVKDPVWLQILVSEYKPQFNPRRYKFVRDTFADRTNELMQPIVENYILSNGEWFSIGGLNAAVEKAERFTDDTVRLGIIQLEDIDVEAEAEKARQELDKWGACDECGFQLNSRGKCWRCWSLGVPPSPRR